MKKLYEKSEITFAILWIVIYTVCVGNLRSLGDDSPILMAALIAISALMFLCVRITGTMEYYGLSVADIAQKLNDTERNIYYYLDQAKKIGKQYKRDNE